MTLRLRLSLLSGGLLAIGGGVLLALSWWLLARHLGRTLPEPVAAAVTGQLAGQYALAMLGCVLVAAGAGWLIAGRADDLLDRLRAAVEREQRFVANAGHELHTPLTVIRTEAEVTLADPDASVEDLRAMGRVTVEALDRTEELLDGLLLLATSEHGPRRDEEVDLSDVARRAVAGLHSEAKAAGVRVTLAAARAPVRGDAALLERLVANLVENAVRHNAGRPASVRVERARGQAVVEVANGGPVIPAAVAGRLAEPFQRLDRGHSARGSGLGLSIVRAIAEAHGGALAIEAPATGGLRARVALPVTAG
jgi:signal transduction histidine kinase